MIAEGPGVEFPFPKSTYAPFATATLSPESPGTWASLFDTPTGAEGSKTRMSNAITLVSTTSSPTLDEANDESKKRPAVPVLNMYGKPDPSVSPFGLCMNRASRRVRSESVLGMSAEPSRRAEMSYESKKAFHDKNGVVLFPLVRKGAKPAYPTTSSWRRKSV